MLLNLMIYYILPIRFRWTILLLGSIVFYCFVSCKALPIMLLTVAFSYGISLFMKRIEEIIKLGKTNIRINEESKSIIRNKQSIL